MKHTVIGILADELGLAYNPTGTTTGMVDPGQRNQGPCKRQGSPSTASHNHQWVGEIVYLERHAGNLWAVGEVDTEPTVAVKVGRQDGPRRDTDVLVSAERISTPDDQDILLRSRRASPTGRHGSAPGRCPGTQGGLVTAAAGTSTTTSSAVSSPAPASHATPVTADR